MSADTADTIVELHSIRKRFKRMRPLVKSLSPRRESDYTIALNGVGVEVKKGQRLGIIGGNGAGKSTLLRIVAGLVAPDEGTVAVFGKNPLNEPYSIRKNLGFILPNIRSFFWRITIRENLEFFATLHGFDRNQAREEALRLIDLLELGSIAHTPYKDVSDGMKQRMAIARGLIGKPELLLIDEGTLHIDPAFTPRVHQMISANHRTVMMVSHNIEEVRKVCTHLLVLKDGKATYYEAVNDETIQRAQEML